MKIVSSTSSSRSRTSKPRSKNSASCRMIRRSISREEIGRPRRILSSSPGHLRQAVAWQISQVARHPQRPYTLTISAGSSPISRNCTAIAFADDHAIVGGLARFNGQPVMVIGHQKGRDTKGKIFRNFGMPRPGGYRKALRLMKLAEKFGIR